MLQASGWRTRTTFSLIESELSCTDGDHKLVSIFGLGSFMKGGLRIYFHAPTTTLHTSYG